MSIRPVGSDHIDGGVSQQGADKQEPYGVEE
jgi:hypothetical protein